MKNRKVKIAWYGKHFGEEPPLVGNAEQGAGAIFFGGCNLHCVFCQNYQISQGDIGREYSIEELADIMLELERNGAVTIDLVTPTMWWMQIREAIIIAREKGLTIPIVWNSNAYEALDILKAMDGLIDVYLPDFKYGDDAVGEKYSGMPRYSIVAENAIREMYRQVKNLTLNTFGIVNGGLIIRHMVLPNNIENSYKALEIIAEINCNITVSLMNQYLPLFGASKFAELGRQVSEEEFVLVSSKMNELGLNGFIQTEKSAEIFVPDFCLENPFGKS